MPPETPSQARTDTANTNTVASEDSPLAAPSGAPARESIPDAADSSDATKFAEAIKRAGMAGPASIALRVAGPLAWIGGQMLWAVQPLVHGLRVGPRKGQPDNEDAGLVPRLARFLEGEGNVAELVAHLESASPSAKKRDTSASNSTRKDHGLF